MNRLTDDFLLLLCHFERSEKSFININNENPRHLASYGMTYTFISIRRNELRLYIIHIIYFHI